jgi:hypothetical protein
VAGDADQERTRVATTQLARPAGSGSIPGSGPCAELRRTAHDRCAGAALAREAAEDAASRLLVAQQAHRRRVEAADRAALAADPGSIRLRKDAAQATFTAARAAAADPDAMAAAARAWLTEISRINVETRAGALRLERERDAAANRLTRIERLTLEAAAALASADAAEAACLAAREAATACEEAAPVRVSRRNSRGDSQPDRSARAGARQLLSELAATPPDDRGSLATALAQGRPLVVRLLQGDRAAMTGLVARLAGDDPAERRRWQVALSDLVDAIVGCAIESGALDFPTDHAFWGIYERDEARGIVVGLAALGYRSDGAGGWSDGRVPSQRDLSLAIGYAGQDPIRHRRWPTEAEMEQLLVGLTVAAEEFLAAGAGGLSLGEVTGLLERRADGLADVWESWGTLRPLLLETT